MQEIFVGDFHWRLSPSLDSWQSNTAVAPVVTELGSIASYSNRYMRHTLMYEELQLFSGSSSSFPRGQWVGHLAS